LEAVREIASGVMGSVRERFDRPRLPMNRVYTKRDDSVNGDLPALTSFVLPGLAVQRRIAHLPTGSRDALFVRNRLAAHDLKALEILWSPSTMALLSVTKVRSTIKVVRP